MRGVLKKYDIVCGQSIVEFAKDARGQTLKKGEKARGLEDPSIISEFTRERMTRITSTHRIQDQKTFDTEGGFQYGDHDIGRFVGTWLKSTTDAKTLRRLLRQANEPESMHKKLVEPQERSTWLKQSHWVYSGG
jgi:hypothetical protein